MRAWKEAGNLKGDGERIVGKNEEMKMSLRSDERGRKTWRVVESQGKRTFQGENCPVGLDVSRS